MRRRRGKKNGGVKILHAVFKLGEANILAKLSSYLTHKLPTDRTNARMNHRKEQENKMSRHLVFLMLWWTGVLLSPIHSKL